MKLNDFLSAVGGIDEDLVEPVAESRTNDKKNPVRFAILIAAVAAAIVAVAAFSLALGMRGSTGTPVAPADGTESTKEQLPATEPIATVSDDIGTDTESDTGTESRTETAPASISSDYEINLVPSYEPIIDSGVNEDPTPVGPTDSKTNKQQESDRQSEKTESDPVESDTTRQTETERKTEPDDSDTEENPPVDPAGAYLMEDFAKIIFELEGFDISYSLVPDFRPLTQDEAVDLWFIQNVVWHGMTQGASEPPPVDELLDNFRQTNVTRGVAASILNQYAKFRGIPDLTVREWRGFSDVNEEDPMSIPVISLYRAGFMDPVEEDRFGIDDPSSIAEIRKIAQIIRSLSDNQN